MNLLFKDGKESLNEQMINCLKEINIQLNLKKVKSRTIKTVVLNDNSFDFEIKLNNINVKENIM